MAIFKKIVIGIIALLLVLIAIAFVLPASSHVERRITINASPAKVFAVLRDFQQFNQWSPWADIDPNVQYSYSGPIGDVGAKYDWRGNSAVGAGSQEITALTPDQEIKIHLIFEGQGDAQVAYRLSADNGSTVIWSFDSEHGFNPLNRWFGLLLDGMIGGDYDKGLAKLKTYVESLPEQAAPSTPTEPSAMPAVDEGTETSDSAGEPPSEDDATTEQ